MSDDDKLLVIPLGEESKTITQTISNDTAMRILDLLAETPLSTSAIAKRLDIPLTTAQYNMEKLIEAGLAKVDKTKYSEKGREVKLYAPARRFIVIVPEKTTRAGRDGSPEEISRPDPDSACRFLYRGIPLYGQQFYQQRCGKLGRQGAGAHGRNTLRPRTRALPRLPGR